MSTIVMWVLVVSHAGVTVFGPMVADQQSCRDLSYAVRGNAQTICVKVNVPDPNSK